MKTYSTLFEGTFTKQYVAQYTGQYQTQYSKQYEGSFETNWISQYTGATYTKQWLGLTVDSSEETISTIYLWIRTA